MTHRPIPTLYLIYAEMLSGIPLFGVRKGGLWTGRWVLLWRLLRLLTIGDLLILHARDLLYHELY
jgi:hypothetical protein